MQKIEELMFTPIYDNKILNTMEELSMNIPQLDEKYEMDLSVYTESKDGSIGFEFREIDGYSKHGEPCLTNFSIEKNYTGEVPYNISFKDSYNECCKKIGRQNDFNATKLDKIKFWIIGENNGIKILMNLRFDNTFENIKSIMFVNFDENDIGTIMMKNTN